MSAMTTTDHRLVVPVPEGGWLSGRRPTVSEERLALAARWTARVAKCARIAGLPTLGPVRVLAVVRLASLAEALIRDPRDARPTLVAALEGLAAAGVLPGRRRDVVLHEELRLGGLDDHGGQLVLRLVEVGRG